MKLGALQNAGNFTFPEELSACPEGLCSVEFNMNHFNAFRHSEYYARYRL